MFRGTAVLAAALCMTAANGVHAQGLKERLKSKVADKVVKQADQGMDSLLNRAEGAIKCVVSDNKCIAKAREAGKPVVVTDKSGKALPEQPYATSGSVPATPTAPASHPAQGPGAAIVADPKIFVNYDFVPGETILFAEDFEADKVGDPASHVQLLYGNTEVANVDGGRMLRATSNTGIKIPLPAVLPPKFTLEFDVKHDAGWYAQVSFMPEDKRDGTALISTSPNKGEVRAGEMVISSDPAEDLSGKLYHFRLMVDGAKSKLYMNGKRVANVPNAPYGRSNGVYVILPASEDAPAFIDNIRIAKSATSLFDVLMAKGRVATQGILFDTNSDIIRPESLPTLQLIADMLTENPQLRLLIEGHTDNVGDDAANMSLSDRRAAAVRSYLVASRHIDENRLQSKGLGETKPAAPNTTPEGRQSNRRVELVKL